MSKQTPWSMAASPLSGDELNGFAWRILSAGDSSLTVAAVAGLWGSNPAFGAWFGARIAALPYSAVRFETPAVTKATFTMQPFECVVFSAPGIDKPADATDFAEHFAELDTGDVATFANLSGDALMVVPCPGGGAKPNSTDATVYPHLVAFLRGASARQQERFWQATGRALVARVQQLGPKPVWLNTAGAAVPWLHLRLDSRPKYYRYEPYRQGATQERER